MKHLYRWIYVWIFLAIIALFGIYFFAQHRFETKKINKIQVKFTSEKNHFISENMVDNLLKQNLPRGSNVKIEDVNLATLEQVLRTHEMIEDAQVYLSPKGVLCAEVKQKIAIARVVTPITSYYIDDKGNRMSLSQEFSAHLPIVFGNVNTNIKDSLCVLLEKARQDEFLKNTLTEIHILADNSVQLGVRDYDYSIEFGKLKEIDKKIQNYKAFVHHAQQDSLIQTYKNVNLRFTEQVICAKHTKDE